MIKKTINYTDYNGVERKEDFYFNLSKAELLEMEAGTTGGFAEMVQRMIDAQDTPALIKVWKEILLKAYGEKSADGRRFIKTEELSAAFAQTEAYSELFMELALNSDKAAEFVKGVIPANLEKNLIEQK